MERIYINYADHKDGYVKRVNVESLLKGKDILLVGEGNFTFTVALAAIRGSWTGIISTRYEPETNNPRPQFDEVQKECTKFCRKNGSLLKVDDDTIQKYVDAVERVEPPPSAEYWQFGIDATDTPKHLIITGMVVMFQCPWLPDDHSQSETPATQGLITKFLRHMSTKQNKGDYVLLGITKSFPFVKDYKLGDLLGENLLRRTDSSGTYNFLGADDTFIQEILKHGYRHQSCHGDRKDIHKDIINKHVTLLFQRNDHDLPAS